MMDLVYNEKGKYFIEKAFIFIENADQDVE